MTGFAKDGDEFVMQQNSIRKGLGLTKPYAPDGKPVVREFAQLREAAIIAGIDPAVPGSDRTVIDCPPEMAELILFAMLAPATAMLLRLVIAHDGSLGAALSKAIVARAEQIGVAGLADISAPSLSGKPLTGSPSAPSLSSSTLTGTDSFAPPLSGKPLAGSPE